MSEQKKYSVYAAANGADTRRQRAVLATLPNSFSIAEDRHSDVLFLSRRDGPVIGELRDRAASTKYIVISGTGDLDRDELSLLDLATKSGVTIVPAMEFMPRVLADVYSTSAGEYQLIDHVCGLPRVDGTARVEALAEQLTFLDYVVSSQVKIDEVRTTSGSVVLAGSVAAQPTDIRLALIRSPLGRAQWSVSLISKTNRTSIEIDTTAMSRPALIRHFDKRGEQHGIDVYQNSHRLTWKALHRVITDNSQEYAGRFSDFIGKIEQARFLLK